MASLPSNTFVFNYNAKNFDGNKTIAKTEGQLYDGDLVLSAAPNSYGDDYITLSSNQYMKWSYSDLSRSSSNPTLTIIAKVKPTGTTTRPNLFSNRDGSDYDYMFRCYNRGAGPVFYLHTATEYAVQINPTTSVNTVALTVSSSSFATLKSYTDNISATATISYGWPNGSGAFFNGAYNLISDEYWSGDFYWIYVSTECLTESEIQAVIDYNEDSVETAKHYVGTSPVKNLCVANTAISAAYIGSQQIWPALGPEI